MADIPAVVTWPTLLAMVRYSAPGSAVFRLRNGNDAQWTLEAQLQAGQVDVLHDLIWVYQMAHTPKNAMKPRRPQPIPRPGVEERAEEGVQHIGSDPIPADQFQSWWDGASSSPEAKLSNEK